MLTGKRSVRVGDEILKEIAHLLIRKVNDPRVKGVTLTGIRMSNDLKHARVFFSALGDETEIKRIKAGLESSKGFIKREIGSRVKLKYIPEIVFECDTTLSKGNHIEKLFQQIHAENEKRTEGGEQ